MNYFYTHTQHSQTDTHTQTDRDLPIDLQTDTCTRTDTTGWATHGFNGFQDKAAAGRRCIGVACVARHLEVVVADFFTAVSEQSKESSRP